MHRLAPLLVVAVLVVSGSLPLSTAAQGDHCFPETGQCIAGRFLQYWEQNGGLAVFGYPITPAQDEVNPDTGQTYLTQWFERNRFELHVDTAAPYDVQLGRLGGDRLRQLGPNWQTFPKGEETADCLWFPETGHSVCEPFKSYWETHGLFDPALSTYARSLALFGLPLSERRMETNSSGDTVETQWFERARFECHPNNPPEFRVVLGLLGNEVRQNPAVPEAKPTVTCGLVAPSNLTATALSSTVIDVAWTDNSTTEDMFVLEYSMDEATWYPLEPLGESETRVRFTGLTPGTTYHFRVKAINETGESRVSNVVSATTFGPDESTATWTLTPKHLR